MEAAGQAGEAFAARMVRMRSGPITWAGLAAVRDEGSNEVGVHRRSFHWVRAPQNGADFAVVHHRMRRSVRTRLLRGRTSNGRAGTSPPR